MWSLNNQTPFSAAAAWGRDSLGAHEWLIAVKASYDVVDDGRLRLSAEQPEVLTLPSYRGEPGRSSLLYDADLLAQKPTTDILANATAYAPGGRPSADFVVRMRVGSVSKSLRVRGDCDGVFALRTPVSMVPIIYERAAGGFDGSDPDPRQQRIDMRNPVGCTVRPRDGSGGRPVLPNLECAGGTSSANPAGFGAIDSFWSPRRELAGTYDDRWRNERLPLLPLDWDPRALLSSPTDQRPSSHLTGGERVELTNLTPGGNLAFNLPRGEIEFITRIGRRRHAHRGVLGSLVIEPDRPRILMVWQGRFRCPSNVDDLDETIVRARRQGS